MKSSRRTAHSRLHRVSQFAGALVALSLAMSGAASAQDVKIVKSDTQIDAPDPGIKLFMREKMAEGNTRFTDDNVILFLHGATAPSTCDFDLSYQDYSWADWMVKRGYVVYMGDYRNYGYSSREKAMDEPAAKNQPVTRSYLALRDIEAMVNHIKAQRGVKKVTLIGWSWGAMMAGYYASLHSENVYKLVLYAPLYDFNDHTNLGPGSALQNKRKPYEFNFALGAYRLASEAANTGRWNGEIPVENTAILRCRSSSGRNAWRPTRRATAAIPRACVRPTACSRIPSTKRPVARCGAPRTSTRPPWSSPVISIPGPSRRIGRD
jgi:pimeloyl-ACP methyl ester carboxylesterase